MSNLTLNMALAQNARTVSNEGAQRDTPMTDYPTAPITAVNGPNYASLREDRDDKDVIPTFAHLIPAIFVPLAQDLLEPMEPAKDRAERLQCMQTSLDANETAVRDNLAWMFEREARRAVAAAKQMYDFSEPHQAEPIGWTEADQLLQSMSTTPVPEAKYHLPPEKLAAMNEKLVFVPAEQLPPHEHTTRQVLVTANNGSVDIEAYSVRHVKPIREKLRKSLERAGGV